MKITRKRIKRAIRSAELREKYEDDLGFELPSIQVTLLIAILFFVLISLVVTL